MQSEIKRIVVFLLILILVSGCAAFPKEELARVGDLPNTSQYKHKPSAFVEVVFYHGLPDKNPTELSQVKDKIVPMVEGAIKKSGLFSSYTLDASAKSEQDYTIKINIYNHSDNEGAAFVMGFISGFTFGVIPATGTDNYTLKLQAIDKEGRALGEYQNKDAIQTWVGIWFIPVMGNTIEKAVNTTLENQIMVALKELLESGKLKYSSTKNFLPAV